METIINKTEYSIKPRMKKRWFRKDVKVFDLIKHVEGEYWSDPSYGNGGGDYRPFKNDSVIYTFDTFAEAETFKTELEIK